MFGCCSKRWETIWFLFMGVCINYCLRVNLSIAAQKMKDELDWDEVEKGYVLSSFFWGYAIGQIPFALLAGEIGCKATFAFSIFMPSLLSLLFPSACKTSLALALFTRALIGLASSACFPSVYHFFLRWIPQAEKTLMISTVHSGMLMGEILGFAASGFLVTTDPDINMGEVQVGGWPSAFYVYAIIGILWTPFFVFTIYSSPEEHPYISVSELQHITNGRGTNPSGGVVKHEYNGEVDIILNADEEVKRALIEDDKQRKNSRATSFDVVGGNLAVPDASSEFAHGQYQNIPLEDDDPNHQGKPILGQNTPKKFARTYNISDIPWTIFFTHPASLALFFSSWVFSFIGFMLLTEIPSYLNDELGYELSDSGLLTTVPYVANFVSVMMFAYMYENFQKTKNWTTRDVRQNASQVAYLGSTLCLVICGFITIPGLAFTFMVFSLFFFGAASSGIACCYLEVAPNFSSMLNTVGNTVGAIAGLTGPLVVGVLTTSFDSSLGWKLVFALTFLQAAISLVIFYKYQSSDVVPELNTALNAKLR